MQKTMPATQLQAMESSSAPSRRVAQLRKAGGAVLAAVDPWNPAADPWSPAAAPQNSGAPLMPPPGLSAPDDGAWLLAGCHDPWAAAASAPWLAATISSSMPPTLAEINASWQDPRSRQCADLPELEEVESVGSTVDTTIAGAANTRPADGGVFTPQYPTTRTCSLESSEDLFDDFAVTDPMLLKSLEFATDPTNTEMLGFTEPAADTGRASALMPSAGSLAHYTGTCKPCAFFVKEGAACANGFDCQFCHLCEAGEKKRRKKDIKNARANFRQTIRGGRPHPTTNLMDPGMY